MPEQCTINFDEYEAITATFWTENGVPLDLELSPGTERTTYRGLSIPLDKLPEFIQWLTSIQADRDQPE